MRSCPSRNAVVRNGTISPAKALGRNWPSGTEGKDRAIGMREVAVRRSGCASIAARTGMGEMLRQGEVRAVRVVVTTSRTYRAPCRGDSLRRAAEVAHSARNRRMEVGPTRTISPPRKASRTPLGASSSLDHSETKDSTSSSTGSVTSIGRSLP